MALAQNISISGTKKVNHHLLWKKPLLITTLLQRLWWHSKGYTTVLGMMLLTFGSLGLLYIYSVGKKLTVISTASKPLASDMGVSRWRF
jgi:hypothetical protein